MAYQQKEGQGSLFKNDKQNDRQPDFRGSLMIKGVLYEVAGWQRTSQNGRAYISLQASEPDPNRGQGGQQGGGSYGQRSGSYGSSQGSYGAPQGGSYYGQSYGRQQSAPQQAPAPTMDDFPGDDPNEDMPF